MCLCLWNGNCIANLLISNHFVVVVANPLNTLKLMKMKAIAISDMCSGGWSSDHHQAWPYSSKRSQNMFHPVNPANDYKQRKSQVSRSLFGPSDPTESHRIACEEFNSRRYGERSRWNFDFYKEKPMNGRYEWRKVSPAVNGNEKKDKYTTGDSDLWSKSPKKYEGKSCCRRRLLLTLLPGQHTRHVDLFVF